MKKCINEIINIWRTISIESVFLFVLFAASLGIVSNSIISVLLVACGACYCLFKRVRFCRRDITCFLIAVAGALYSCSSEGIRYFLLLVSLVLWSKLHHANLVRYVQLLIILMLLFSLKQFADGIERVTGFMTSPTQAACVLLICESYLLMCMANAQVSKFSMMLSIGSIVLIFLTGTRSNLLAAIAIFAFFFLRILINQLKIKNRRNVYLFVLAFFGVIALIVASKVVPTLMQKLNRPNAADSTNTRIVAYKRLLSQILRNPVTFLFGNKGGFVEIYLKEQMNVQAYFPGHQDYLVVICEYGVIGAIAVFYTFLKSHPARLYFLLVFTVCSFHNIILAPSSMLLMWLTMIDLEQKGYTFLPVNRMDTLR